MGMQGPDDGEWRLGHPRRSPFIEGRGTVTYTVYDYDFWDFWGS